MDIDRRAFIAGLGGVAAVNLMSDEAKADALEDFMTRQLNQSVAQTQTPAGAAPTFPTVADLEAQIETRIRRRGVGNLFVAQTGNVKRLTAMSSAPTLMDFFKLRFNGTSNHCLQSANRAVKTGMSEEVVLACLLHDVVQELIKVDHGWWGAQLFEPYVPERTTFANLYHRVFGRDYKPEPYIEQTYQTVRKHKWYGDARMVTVNDLYAFDPNAAPVNLEQFTDIIGRHFKQPKQGLGYDNSPVAHMWRSIERPDAPL